MMPPSIWTVLGFLGAVSIGLLAAYRQQMRARQLQAVVLFLHRLETDLKFGGYSTRDLIQRAADHPAFEVLAFLPDCVQKMDTLSFRDAWKQALSADGLRSFRASEREYLYAVGEVLGQMQAEAQCAALLRLCQPLEEAAQEAHEHAGEKARLFRTLGALGGLGWLIVWW